MKRYDYVAAIRETNINTGLYARPEAEAVPATRKLLRKLVREAVMSVGAGPDGFLKLEADRIAKELVP